MAIPFFMLIRTKKGKAFSVVQEAQKIEGVKIVHSVMGHTTLYFIQRQITFWI